MDSGISAIVSPENPNKLRDKRKKTLQEKPAGNISNINNEELVAIAGKLIENKFIYIYIY